MHVIVYLHIVSYLIFVGTFFHLAARFVPRFVASQRQNSSVRWQKREREKPRCGKSWNDMVYYGFIWLYMVLYHDLHGLYPYKLYVVSHDMAYYGFIMALP